MATVLMRRRRVSAKPGFRWDIQALRAIAVSVVVLNHLWEKRMPGGFIGVDIFFVISGFLISSHLIREAGRTGKIKLWEFYQRRIRRLLPAAFLVILVSCVAVLAFVPFTLWARTGLELASSALYVENWILAAQSVDYFAIGNVPTVVQHYWSLSVEEQFYLVWPMILLGCVLLGKRVPARWRRYFAVAIAVIGAASFIYGVVEALNHSSSAYFSTFVRAWEFAAGSLVAILASRLGRMRLNHTVSAVLQVAAVVVLIGTAFLLPGGANFPGYKALLAVIPTALIILLGTLETRNAFLDKIYAFRPIQFLGGISYSVYLWHWPLIVVIPYITGAPLNVFQKLWIIVATLLVAWLSKRFVEDRFIVPAGATQAPAKSRARRLVPTFAAMVAGMVVICLAATGMNLGTKALAAQAEHKVQAALSDPCFGAKSVDNPQCSNPFAEPLVATGETEDSAFWLMPGECTVGGTVSDDGKELTPGVCDFGSGARSAEHQDVWIVGDSHGQQWQSFVFKLAKKRHWKVMYSFLGGCPLADAPFLGFDGEVASPPAVARCQNWGAETAAQVTAAHPDKVFFADFVHVEPLNDGTGRDQMSQYTDALSSFWKQWTAAGAHVYAFRDNPLNTPPRDPKCLPAHADTPDVCGLPRAEALPEDPMSAAANRTGRDLVTVLDPTKYFCDDQKCYAVTGGMPVYFDAHHLSGPYVKQLAPLMESLIV